MISFHAVRHTLIQQFLNYRWNLPLSNPEINETLCVEPRSPLLFPCGRVGLDYSNKTTARLQHITTMSCAYVLTKK